jgi:hypothetical protein
MHSVSQSEISIKDLPEADITCAFECQSINSAKKLARPQRLLLLPTSVLLAT